MKTKQTISFFLISLLIAFFVSCGSETNKEMLAKKWKVVSAEFENATPDEQKQSEEAAQKAKDEPVYIEFQQDGGVIMNEGKGDGRSKKKGRREITGYSLQDESGNESDNGSMICLNYTAEDGDKVVIKWEIVSISGSKLVYKDLNREKYQHFKKYTIVTLEAAE